MIEKYSDKFHASQDEDTRIKLKFQSELDLFTDAYSPLIRGSPLREHTPLGVVNLHSLVHRGRTTTLYTLKEFPNLIIKYQAHCFELNEEVHPLLRDSWYMHEASAQKLGPRVHFISPPSDLCEFREGKCAFTMEQDEWDDCRSDRGSLRYMIMDRADGMCLHAHRRLYLSHTFGAMDFPDAMIIGVHLIDLLQKLHLKARVVHGDIHSPNIMINITNTTTGLFTLSLIDFGRAFRYSQTPLPTVPIRPANYWYHQYFTQWQIDGFAWAARDDLLKAIQTIAHLMHPFTYFDFERGFKDAGHRTLRKWKLEANWFLTPFRDPVKLLPISPYDKYRIYAQLDTIMKIGRGMDINGPLPYRQLKSAMNECVRIARGLPQSQPVSTSASDIGSNSTLTN